MKYLHSSLSVLQVPFIMVCGGSRAHTLFYDKAYILYTNSNYDSCQIGMDKGTKNVLRNRYEFRTWMPYNLRYCIGIHIPV